MKYLRYLLIGTFFGIVLVKGQVISWYRIQEMFRFQDFHMYGIIGGAAMVGALSVFLLKAFGARSVDGEVINPEGKSFQKVGNIAGGSVFGLGWALTGACPGPLYALIGTGYPAFLLAVLGALTGAAVYGVLRPKLPH